LPTAKLWTLRMLSSIAPETRPLRILMPSVFISYSHDPADPTHADRVAGLAASLWRDGLKVFFDQKRGVDEEKLPWPIWMEGK
jgi:hypothetical protein